MLKENDSHIMLNHKNLTICYLKDTQKLNDPKQEKNQRVNKNILKKTKLRSSNASIRQSEFQRQKQHQIG